MTDQPTPDQLAEITAWVTREPDATIPKHVDHALAWFTRALHRQLPDEQRPKLEAYIPRLVGTAGDGKTERRVWMSVDTLFRQIIPLWLDAADLPTRAADVRDLDEVRDRASSRRAYDALGPVLRAIDEKTSPAANVAKRTTSWARAYAYYGSLAGLFALSASLTAGSAGVINGAALARSRGLDVPSGTLEASDAVLFDLLDRMITAN